MVDFIIVAVVAAIVGLAGWYVRKSFKAGKTCIGCPHSGSCGGCCSSREN